MKSGIYGIGRVIFYQKTDCPKKCGSCEFYIRVLKNTDFKNVIALANDLFMLTLLGP